MYRYVVFVIGLYNLHEAVLLQTLLFVFSYGEADHPTPPSFFPLQTTISFSLSLSTLQVGLLFMQTEAVIPASAFI